MKRIPNYQLRESLANEYRTAFSGRYSVFLDTLGRYTLRALPLGVKFLVRKNIGSMTFSWGMIFFAAVWARFILEDFSIQEGQAAIGNFVDTWSYFEDYGMVVKVLAVVFSGLMKFLFCIVDFIPFSIINNEESTLPQLYPFFISVIVLVMGAIRKEDISKKHKSKIPFDPLHHGDSIFVLAFLWLSPLFKTSEELKQKAIEWQRFIEIVMLGVLIYLFWLFGHEWPFLDVISKFLLIGTIAILFENWSIRRQLRREVEAQFAMEYKTKRIQEAYQSYYSSEMDEMATVSPVSRFEMEYIQTNSVTPNGSTVHRLMP